MVHTMVGGVVMLIGSRKRPSGIGPETRNRTPGARLWYAWGMQSGAMGGCVDVRMRCGVWWCGCVTLAGSGFGPETRIERRVLGYGYAVGNGSRGNGGCGGDVCMRWWCVVVPHWSQAGSGRFWPNTDRA